MPDRSRERTNERGDRKRISSAVVVSKSFQKAQEKRHSPEPRRERRYRQRSPDGSRETDRGARRMHMDREENREGRRQRISERLGPRTRKGDEPEDNDDKDDRGSRWKQRNERFSRRGRSPPSFANQQRRTVFDRLDNGPPRGRGFDQRMIEVEVNPQDVPRGKRYFMHDDREMPRRQKLDRSRARSRSPLWVHDRFDDLEGEEEQEEKGEPEGDDKETKTQDEEISQDQQRERVRQNHWRN
ncbi:unnamed protein product [Porites lobata]|uniref:Btz domain-containing protein n=1 Tax=Porites lobata TaxID=104759 RepID=A0ABN8NYK9_9CNID|nr:unnamed protein product [Porites lobata]